MAKNDVRVKSNPYGTLPVRTWQTDAGDTAILQGEPVKLKAAGSPYAIPLADADLTIGTDTVMLGIAATNSDHTASVDGTVEVYVPLPGVEYEMTATTAANVDTQAEIDALVGDRVTIDLADGVYTIDENDGDGANNAFYITGGDPDKGTLTFTVRADATYLSA